MSIWRCGKFVLPLGEKTYVMGIVNATPDSFSGDGVFAGGVPGSRPLDRALQMIEDGADILDIGGESTRPGALPISLDEERQRVLPLLESLVAQVEIPISIDTTKAELAREAIQIGASIINDISAGTFDDAMLGGLESSDCGVALMHLRGTPQTMRASMKQEIGDGRRETGDVIAEVLAFWQERVAAARAAGISQERICLDAGFGFGKSLDENLEILRRGQELKNFGLPILSGTSRKSTIGKVLGEVATDERIWGTAATVALAIQSGADIVRVHDVKQMAQVACMTDAIVRGYNESHG